MPPSSKYFFSASAEASIFLTDVASVDCDSFKFKFHTALSAFASSEAVPVTVMALPARAANPPPTLYKPRVNPEDKIAAAKTADANLMRSLASKFIP